MREVWERRNPDLPVKSPDQLVILASIIEKETGKPEERTRVAAVFANRLKQKMKLQSDPTIIYGLVFGKGTLGRPISKADIAQPTPYNTYVIDGLPPGPIANPGRASIEAAANPRAPRSCFSSPTAPAGMPSPRPTISIRRMSRACASSSTSSGARRRLRRAQAPAAPARPAAAQRGKRGANGAPRSAGAAQ